MAAVVGAAFRLFMARSGVLLSTNLRETVSGAVEPDRCCVIGAAKRGGDLPVRQALPRGEEQHLSIAGAQLLKRVDDSSDLETIERDRLRFGMFGHKGLQAGGQSLAPRRSSTVVRENSRDNAVEPRQERVRVGRVVAAAPEDGKRLCNDLLRGGMVDAAPKRVGEDCPIVLEVRAAEARLSV
ncbi:MAG TPA: hypothetical protein VJ247_07425 [Gaiella sp.]|nr:hypothetical protein [Gaiella sp.]